MPQSSPVAAHNPRITRNGWWVLAAGIATLVVLAGGLLWHYAQQQREEALLHWQRQMSLLAESRVQSADEWLAARRGLVEELARNVTIRLYLTEASLQGAITEAAAQETYVRMLLQVSAEKMGWKAEPSAAPEAAAEQGPGIALLNARGDLVVGTAQMALPLVREQTGWRKLLPESPTPSVEIRDVTAMADGTPLMAWRAPVFAVQGQATAEDLVGYVAGVGALDATLLRSLVQPGVGPEWSQVQLIRQQEQLVEVITPRADAPTQWLPQRFDIATPQLDIAFAIEQPGGFALKKDIDQRPVAMVSRHMTEAPWTLVHHVDAAEVLKESRLKLRQASGAIIGAFTLMVLVLVAVWRHASSLRAEATAAEYKRMSERLARQEQLLRLMADSEPDRVWLVDDEGMVRYANRAAAESSRLTPEYVVGRPLSAIMPVEQADTHRRSIEVALSHRRMESRQIQEFYDDKVRVLQTSYIPLTRIPDPDRAELHPGVLLTQQDISEVVLERDRRERTLGKLVSTLMAVVDSRDHYAANHSARVARLSSRIAEQMRLDPVQRETSEVAGMLLNLGKVLVPEAILTRAGPLSKEEMQKIRASILAAADLLEGVEFDGPVSDVIRQSMEHWDGSGMMGLKGEKIQLAARIVAVSNAFVSMVSARSYRDPKSIDEVLKILLSQIGVQYDRAVVVALANYIENTADDVKWLHEGYEPIDNKPKRPGRALPKSKEPKAE